MSHFEDSPQWRELAEQAAELAIKSNTKLSPTTKEALIQSRRGQGRFRSDLMALWNGRCAITGVSNPKLLRASHIRPWCKSTDKQRLDRFNGILLSPQYDFAFDAGLISFDDTGSLIPDRRIDAKDFEKVGINVHAKLSQIDTRHKEYLNFHLKNEFGRSVQKRSDGKIEQE